MPSMPNVRASSGTIGTTCLPICLSRTSVARIRTNAIVVEISRSPVPSSCGSKAASGGHRQRRGLRRRAGASRRARAALAAGTSSPGCRRRLVEGAVELLVGERDVEAVAELLQRVARSSSSAGGDVLALAGLAHAVALDRLGEDHGRLALVLDRGRVGGVDLDGSWPPRSSGQISSSVMSSTIAFSSGDLPKNARACRRRPSPCSSGTRRRRLLHALRAEAAVVLGEQRVPARPQMTLMTFQPAPRKFASSSWMILPLPRTGPSRRCRLQLMTKIRLSSFSRPASEIAPSDSGSSTRRRPGTPTPCARRSRPARGPAGTS